MKKKLITIITICCMLFVCLAAVSCAENTEDNGENVLDFSLTADGTGYVVNGLLEYGNEYLDIPSLYNGKPVVKINNNAFTGSNIKSVKIPDTVTSIGDDAFSNCNSLLGVIIPDSVTTIGDYAFRNCNSLSSVFISDSLISIGDYAFHNCNSLTYNTKGELNYLGSSFNPYIYLVGVENTNVDTIYIDGSCSFIAASAFYKCKNIISVDIPYFVTSIGEKAFYGCDSLTRVGIGDGVTHIGSKAFYGCGITSITIPYNVSSIGERAFSSCVSLSSVTFGARYSWYVTENYSDWKNKAGGTNIELNNTYTNATNFKSTYENYYWYKL